MNNPKKGLPFLVATTASTIAGVALLGLPTTLASYGSMSLVGLVLAAFAVTTIAACFSQIGTLVSRKHDGIGFLQLISVSLPHEVGLLGELLSIGAILASTYYLGSFIMVPAILRVATLVYPPAATLNPGGIALAFYLLAALLLYLPRVSHSLITRGQYLIFGFKVLLGITAVIASIYSFHLGNLISNFQPTDIALLPKLTQMSAFGLTGFELVLNLTKVAQNPKRDIPRAILLGTLLGDFIYFSVTAIVLGTVTGPTSALATKNTLAVLMEVLQLPSWVTTLGHLGVLLISSIGVYTWLYALSHNMERVLQTVVPGRRPQANASRLLTILGMLVLCGLNLPTVMILAWATKLMAATYLLVCLAYLVYCVKTKKLLGATLPILACGFSAIMLVI